MCPTIGGKRNKNLYRKIDAHILEKKILLKGNNQ